jgi:RNA polymerase sigma-70 factor (ECF subfamily)
LRDAARRGKRYGEVPLEDEASRAPNPEHQVAMRTDVTRAIQQLDPLQRQLLWLAYAQGVSHDEIAEILGLRSISIRTLLFRAKKKLAALLTGRTS